MPHYPLKLQPGNGSRIRNNRNVYRTRRNIMLFMFSMLLMCISAEGPAPMQEGPAESESASEFTCPRGPGELSCTCTQTEVDCSGVGLLSVPTGFGSGVQSLILKNNALSSIDSITSQYLPSLLYIDASYNSITSIDWSSFSSLTSLEELHLQMNLIFWVDISHFYGSRLRFLNVSGNQLFHVLEGSNELPLERLYIENCGLTFFGFGASTSLCKLRILHAGSNSFSSLPENALHCMTDLEEIKLNNLGLIALAANTFADNTLLQHIDLSDNQLTSLPSTIFDGLDSLMEINLAGNPWMCDCSLLWLKLFMDNLLASGGSVLDADVTFCNTESERRPTITGLTAYEFSDCEGGHKSVRVKRSVVAAVSTLSWSVSCLLWQTGLSNVKCGPSNAASCVYDFPSQTYAIVQYTSDASGVSSESECRDSCHANGNIYFMFDDNSNSGTICLCGDVISVAGCTDCDSPSSSSSTGLCQNIYSNLGGATSTMHDFDISISPSPTEVMSEVTFTISGGVSLYDSFLWNFGDANTRSVLNDKSVSHTYIYPGQFDVTVNLTSSSSQNVPPMQVVIQVTVIARSDEGTLSCPTSVVSTSDMLSIEATFSSAWNQNVQWTREDPGGQGGRMEGPEMAGSGPEKDGECEGGWTQFRGRCIQAFSSLATMSSAHSDCASQGGRLLRFFSSKEIEELASNSMLFSTSSGQSYHTGAEWSIYQNAYTWRYSADKAHVFKETLVDSTAGNCVALGASGLTGTDCDDQLPYVCEKDPVSCTGNRQSGGHTCYVVVTQTATWDQAQMDCQVYTNGRLVSVPDTSTNSYISGLLASQSWIGLRASTLQGHYTWEDGQALTGYSNWMGGAGAEPCVSINSSGVWQTESCDNQNSYICEYFVGDNIQIPWLVNGYVSVTDDNVASVAVTEDSSSWSTTVSRVTLLPGSWFSHSGHVLKWNIRIERLTDDTKLAVQIWRPKCSTGNLTRPGCGSTSPLFSCISSQVQSCSSSDCINGFFYCLLTQACQSVSQPCTCSGVTPSGGIDCQNIVVDAETAGFQLVYATTIAIPAHTEHVYFEPPTSITVQEGDVIGFQSEDTDVVMCEASSTSIWRHPVLSANVGYWMDAEDDIYIDPLVYQLSQDVVCRINVIYAPDEVTSAPNTLNYVTEAGTYMFTMETSSSNSQTCSITTLDEVEGLLWVYPSPIMDANSNRLVYVESGNSPDLTIKLLKGSDPTVSWSIDGGSPTTTSWSSSCPSSITSQPDICHYDDSFLASPYSYLSHTFTSSSPSTSIAVNISNSISSLSLQLTVNVFALITNIEFYHDDCDNHTACEVLVEVGVNQEFHLNVISGDLETVTYYEDGSLISPAPTNLMQLSRTFLKSADYVLSVNASNPLSWMTANLTVRARIRANLVSVTFDNILDKIAVDTSVTISATAPITSGAYIEVTWSVNNASFVFHPDVDSDVLNPTAPYIFHHTGNITISLHLEDAFGDSVSTSMVVEVFKEIDTVDLSLSASSVAVSEDFNLTIRVGNASATDDFFFGPLNFVVNWGDGSAVSSWKDASPVQETQNQYSAEGTYTITVEVFSDFSPHNVKTSTIIIEIEESITNLTLIYDGPKHVSEPITFTASRTRGSNVMYSIDFGDGNSLPAQASPIFTYQYSQANVYKATVTAENAVSRKTKMLTLYAYDENLLQIIKISAKNCVAVNSTVEISTEVAAESPHSLAYSWEFGNGHMMQGIGMTSVSTTYEYIGLYTVTLSVSNISTTNTDSSNKDICVEEEISGLSVNYQSPVALRQPPGSENVNFIASVVKGSNLTYTWSVDDNKSVSQYDTLNLTVTEARTYRITAKVQNDINRRGEEFDFDLVVIEVISSLNVLCSSCYSSVYTLTQQDTSLEATIQYGTSENYTWSFNDSSISSLTGKSVQHNFVSAGIYQITLLCQNAVSNESAVLNVLAQDKVTGVDVTASASVVQVNTDVIFQASYTAGSSVSYQWSCDSVVVTNRNTASLTQSFPSAGYHACTVTVSNEVSSGNHTIQISVLDEITDLSINQTLTSKSGSTTLFGATGTQYTFSPVVNTEFLVSYEWTLQQPSTTNTTDTGSTLRYTFQTTGTYFITLKASNDIGTKEVSIRVEVQEEITQLSIDSNVTSPIMVFVGEGVSFQAVTTSGSDLSYQWTLNGTALTSTVDSASVTFTSAGSYTVEVIVTNNLTSVTSVVSVSVYVRVSGVAIEIQQSVSTLPYLSRGTSLDFSAPATTGSGLIYEWVITHASSGDTFKYDQASISFAFNRTGTYRVNLEVQNPLSSEQDTIELFIQGPITQLKVTFQDTLIATGTRVRFTADINSDATDVQYIWIVGSEVRKISSFSKQFTVAGVYNVSVTVQNNVTSMYGENPVRVLDAISNLQILDCNSVREAQVSLPIQSTIDSGTNVTFAWNVEMNNQNTTFTNQNITVAFQAEGIYNVYLTASNDIDVKTAYCQLIAHLPISQVSVEITDPSPDYLFQNQDITFTSSGNNLQFATFSWTISSIGTHNTTSNVYTTTMTGTGDFTLILDVFNGISHVQVTLDFEVHLFLCQLPDVSIVGATSRSVQRSYALELEVAVDPKGCTIYVAVHTWKVYMAPDCSGDLSTAQEVDIGDTTISSPSIVIQPRVLEVGTYCVHFSTGYHYTSVSESAYYTVNVTASPLNAVIRGGSRRTVAVGSEVCLDGSLSYDPDYSIPSDSLQYKWNCAEVGVMSATGGCFQSNSLRQFCYQNFTVGKYNIELQVDGPGRDSHTAQQIIEVLNVQGFLPIASIVCESCSTLGNYRVSSSQHVALSATCENCVCQPAFLWKVFEGGSEITLNSSQTSTGVSSENLVLKKWGAFRDGFDYTFVVYASCVNGSSSTGTASLVLSANMPPEGGYCTFNPTVIVPLEDQVTISCFQWYDSDDPRSLISYKIYVDTQDPLTNQSQTYPLYTGTDETQSVYLGSFTGESIVMRVMVADEFGATALGGQSTITFQSSSLASNMTKTDYLMNQTDTVLSALIKQASPISLLQYAIALGQQLNSESRKDEHAQTAGRGMLPEQSRAAIRDAITICLSTSVPITTLEDVQQMAFALRLITDYSIEYLTQDSQILMTNTLQVMDRILQQTVSNGLDRDDVPTSDLISVMRNLLSAANTRVYSSGAVWETGRTVTVNDFDNNFQDLRPEISTVVGNMDFVDISLDETHRKLVVASTVPLLESVLVCTLQTMMVDEESIELELNGVKIIASRSYARKILLQHISDTTQVDIPSTILSQKKGDQDEVFQVLISHQQNPYTYGYNSNGWASMPVQTLSFYETNGSYIQVSNLADESKVQLYMLSSNVNTTLPISAGLLNQSDVYEPSNGVEYKSVSISPERSKIWQVPDGGDNAGDGVGVHIQLRIQFEPNATDSSNFTTTTVTAYLGINSRPSSNEYDQKLTLTSDLMTGSVDHRTYTFFRNDLTSSDTLYIVVRNDDKSHTVTLSVGTYFSSCEFFDTVSETWAFDGCQAQEESIAAVTSCQCNHLTSFGGTGIVSITDIDFSDLDDLNFSTNPVVFIACAIIFVTYVLIAILCRYLDILDLRRISRIPLCGRDGPYKYEITLITGRYYSAGTSAHVGIKLYGSQSKGEARHLTKPGGFQRNCRDTFLVAHDTCLGDINKVLVWHDNTGLSPSWFLSHMMVRDLQTGTTYHFLVNSWLTLEMEDGVIQKTVKAADEEELKKFYSKFSTVFHGLLADLHTWFSVTNRPDHSRFTRVQRVTCCLTCMYLYMCINAMWYGLFKNQTEVNQPLSWDSFGWEEIVIALLSTIMVLPFYFGLSYIFKKSRCKPTVFQEALRPSTAQTIEIDAMCDMSRDGGSYRTVTPLGDWVPAIDRESTTDSFAAPVGLKRTAPMHRGFRKGSSDSNIAGRERPPIASTGSKRELWNKDNIMQSWPDKMPTWIKQVKDQVKGGGSRSNAAAGEGPSGVASRRSSRSFRTVQSGTRSYEDSDEDLQQKLNEADAEIARAEERRRKRKEMKLRRESTDDLFESDDDWVNEGLEDAMQAAKPAPFNPRREAELGPNMDRRPSHTSFTTRSAISRKTDSAGGRKRDNSFLSRDGTRPSIMSSTSKSKSTMSDNHGRMRSLSTTSQLTPGKQSGCSLPPWCVYVAYGMCFNLCLLSIILVLLYGYNFGSSVALKWVLSLLFSVFCSILVVEPLKVLVLTVVMALLTKDVREDTDMIDVKPTIESNEQIKDVRFRPLGGFALLQAKEEGKKKQYLQTMIREVLMFTIMFGFFLAIVYINYSSVSMYHATNNIHNKFYSSLDNTASASSLNFTNMKSIPEFWSWSQTVLAESLHLRELYTTETFGYLMGPAWLRQIRGKIETCPAALSTALWSVPELVSRRCVDTGTPDPDTQSYDMAWTSGGANWTYTSSGQLDLFSKFGQSLFYPGGGYVQTLGQTYNETLTILGQLQADEWIDLLTRAVFVEFSLFYPSEDLTSAVTLIIEFPNSGGILTSSTIRTEKLLRFTSGIVDPLMICQIVFLPFIIYMSIIVFSTLRGQRLKFFTHLWNWLDLLTCTLAWVNTGLYIACVVTATNKIEDYLTDLTAPAHLEEVAMLHAVLRYVHAFLLFLFSLKIVKQIRFSRPLYKFYTTLSTASGPLMGVFFIFIILLLIYAQFGYLLYGSVIYSYRSFQNSVTSLFGLMGSRTNFWPFFESDRVLTHFFFISFGVFVYGLVICLSVAVLTWSYKWSRSQMTYKTTLEARDYEMIEFMIKQFKLMTGMQKQKPSFRHVKFEGLPSLPSRATSSNISSRQSCSSPVSNTSDSAQQDAADQHMDYCMASLLPTWDQVLQTFQKIEDLEKQEEDVTRKLQDVVKIWRSTVKSSPRDGKLDVPATKPIMGKPPLDAKATFSRFRSRGTRNITIWAGRTSMTPPSTFTSDSPWGTRNQRPFSDQGMRRNHEMEDTDVPGRSVFGRQNGARVSPASSESSSIFQRGSPGSGFFNKSDRNSAGSIRSEGGIPTHYQEMAGGIAHQKQAWGTKSHDTSF